MEQIREDVQSAVLDVAVLIRKGTLQSYEQRLHAAYGMGISAPVILPALECTL